MELDEIVSNYFGKKIRIVDIDGDEFVGLFSLYEYAVDTPEERDTISIHIDNYYIDFFVDEISTIEVLSNG